MIKKSYTFFRYLVVVMLVLTACKGGNPEKKSAGLPVRDQESKAIPVVGNETAMLLKDLADNGDYVNSQVFPSLIKASVVHESLGKNILVIDLRSPKLFSEGHIRGAVNKRFEDLPDYFETGIKPFTYDKIIVVSEDGQVSGYTTCLLRLMGYGNVYSMRWGMSAWNKKCAGEGWLKGISGKYESALETRVNEKPQPGKMPDLATGRSNGEDIGSVRFHKLFAEGTSKILITADEVFTEPQKFYIINLDRKDKYEDGHIPGAVRYKPEGTLGYIGEMASIPSDKTVVVYCGTGHNSGFATAFLRLFGYDARTLKYGNNSFMYNKMVSQKTKLSWLPFTEAEVNNFELVR